MIRNDLCSWLSPAVSLFPLWSIPSTFLLHPPIVYVIRVCQRRFSKVLVETMPKIFLLSDTFPYLQIHMAIISLDSPQYFMVIADIHKDLHIAFYGIVEH